MIAEGESDGLEFKSTLRWDLKEGKESKKLEEVVIKTVAAFANSNGGTLLLGVDDEGHILGLDHDYLSLGEANRDKFERHLRNLLNHQFGVAFVTTKVQIRFHQIEDRELCEIETSQAKEPAIVKVTDKNGQASEKFYVRSGNSS